MNKAYGSEEQEPEETTKRELWAWWLYNFAFEPISAVALQVFLPLILEGLPRAVGHLHGTPGKPCPLDDDPQNNGLCVLFDLGLLTVNTTSFASYTIAVSVLLQALVFVSMGSLADYGRLRKLFLIVTTVLGAICTVLIASFSRPDMYWYAAVLMILVNVFFGTASVFYNAYLPLLVQGDPRYREIAGNSAEKDMTSEEVILKGELLSSSFSTTSFIVGYVAGIIVLAISAAFVYFRGNAYYNVQLCVMLCGIWWVLFAVWPLYELKYRPGPNLPAGTNYLAFSWRKIFGTFSKCRQLPNTFRFLLCYFLFSDGFSTIGWSATLYARQELRATYETLIICALLAPICALIGNFFFQYVQKTLQCSGKTMLISLICLMALIPLYGTAGFVTTLFGLHHGWEVYLVASYYGFLIGAIQSFSRVLFAELIPRGDESEFFSLYAITDKGSSCFGPIVIAALADVTGQPRFGFLFLAILLLAPVPALIWHVDMAKGKQDAFVFAQESVVVRMT